MTIFNLDIFGFTIAPSYYGLMYAFAFIYGIWFIKQSKKYTNTQRESLFVYIFLGVLFGGRLGYVVFYNPSYYLDFPFEIFAFWQGGMSFHGGMLGVICACYFFAKKYKINKWDLGDDISFIAPVGILFGRIGNYINKELLGFPYNGLLAVQVGDNSYFPSPLLEALFEGLIIYLILRYFYTRKSFHGQIVALFLIFYGIFRFSIEILIRTPDAHIGYYFGFLTQGSLLSLPMVVIGMLLYYFLSYKNATK